MPKANPLPPLEFILELFYCNPETGILVWKNPRNNRISAGKIAGWMDDQGYLYVQLRINGKDKTFSIHRLVWFVATGVDPGAKQIDHIDGNRSNNQIKNLRLANHIENAQNAKKRRDNSSGYKGVSWCKQKNKWRARISVTGRRFFLGHFDTPELAHMAYCKAAAELHGEFARGQ